MSQVETVVQFLEEELLSDADAARTVLQSSPRILQKNTTTYLAPTVRFLQSLYGPSLFAEAIRRNPNLLLVNGLGGINYYSYEKAARVEDYLIQELNLSPGAIAKLKQKSAHSYVFSKSIPTLEETLSFLRTVLQTNYNPQQITTWLSKSLVAYPQVFCLSVESNLQPSIQFLQDYCRFSDEQLASLLYKSGGSILGLSVSDNLEPKLEFLQTLLGTTVSLQKCILRHSSILGLSLSNLQKKVDYFHWIGEDLAARMARSCPAVYSLSWNENLYPTLLFLSKIWGVDAPPVDGTITAIIDDDVDSCHGTEDEEEERTLLLRHEHYKILQPQRQH
eukprot:CAMPEP_0178905836 /NCGR_PEP_ID=MMETSP0786-20121207/6496_1 /TAXON_ID=186022 /ORGANISM="Thalassionema frauenfeldii, Strain CCMP 1798" /LENGTH=333 /DNA_ID=CAMNT_0020577487 /DNA_START=565 /DNA_END=1566 /DNA_ORIENTATION=-